MKYFDYIEFLSLSCLLFFKLYEQVKYIFEIISIVLQIYITVHLCLSIFFSMSLGFSNFNFISKYLIDRFVGTFGQRFFGSSNI